MLYGATEPGAQRQAKAAAAATVDLNAARSLTRAGPQQVPAKRPAAMDAKARINVKYVGVGLFAAASLFCVYELLTLGPNEGRVTPKKPRAPAQLRLVSVLSRHGDRAPSDELPANDPHRAHLDLYWPAGLGKLTELGRARQFRLGLELAHRYEPLVGLNPASVLALSSQLDRCQESARLMLAGLFNLERPRPWAGARGPQSLRAAVAGPGGLGPGGARSWQQVPIDTSSLPSLFYMFLNQCDYRKRNPAALDADLLASGPIAALPAVGRLKELLRANYNQSFDFEALGLWSTLAAEMNLRHSAATAPDADHYLSWAAEPVEAAKPEGPNLFELYEHLCVLAYRDRLNGTADYIQSGPIIASLLDSQRVALGLSNQTEVPERARSLYGDKRLVLYMTHDSILQRLLFDLNVMRVDMGQSFASRFNKFAAGRDPVGPLLEGLRMTSYGMSAALELWQSPGLEGRPSKGAFLTLALYNEDDARLGRASYQRVDFGSICRRAFRERYPTGSASADLSRFYADLADQDTRRACPWALFRNLSEPLAASEQRVQQLCGGPAPAPAPASVQ